MKNAGLFLLAGLVTVLLFTIPSLEQVAFLYAWIGFGPAILFAGVLLFLTKDFYPRPNRWAVLFISLFAYWCGEVFNVQLQHRDYFGYMGHWVNYVSPLVGAFVLLSCFAMLRQRLHWDGNSVMAVMLGTACAFLSAVPLWLADVFKAPNYPSWGIHILVWYLSVGPFALSILAAGRAKEER